MSMDWADPAEFPHIVYTGPGDGWRFARVLKTVAYIVVDEADDGTPEVQKWAIRCHKTYS